MEFKVWVDGEPISPNVEIRAFKKGKDITARLRSLGLPASVTDQRMESAISNLPHGQLERLEQEALIVSEEFGQGNKTRRIYWPWWKTRVQYYWTQHFPAKGHIQVLHMYRPVGSGSYITANDDGASSVGAYCGGSDAVNLIKDAKARHPAKHEEEIVLEEKCIQYILTTAKNWSGPIHKFRLAIVADSSDDIVLTCLPGLKRVAPTRYEIVLSDFRPDRDLDILILQATR